MQSEREIKREKNGNLRVILRLSNLRSDYWSLKSYKKLQLISINAIKCARI